MKTNAAPRTINRSDRVAVIVSAFVSGPAPTIDRQWPEAKRKSEATAAESSIERQATDRAALLHLSLRD
jgi:hypothetical protein